MPKKIKAPLSDKSKRQSRVYNDDAGELGKTVGHLLQSHRSRAEKIQKLRSNRAELRQEHELQIAELEKKYLQVIEEAVKDIEITKAAIAEEKHRNTQLNSSKASGKTRLEQLNEEIVEITEMTNKATVDLEDAIVKKDQLNEEIKSVRQERSQATKDLNAYKAQLSETKKGRRALESEQEKLKYTYEAQMDKICELESRLSSLNQEKISKIEANSGRLSKVREDLNKRYSDRRLEKERKIMEKKYNEKLDKILEQTKDFNNEQLREYTERIKQIKGSCEKMKQRRGNNDKVKEEIEAGLSELDKEIEQYETETDKLNRMLKDASFLTNQNRMEVERVAGKVNEEIEAYYNLVKTYEFQINEKITILKHLNEAREVLQKENLNRENSIMSAVSDFNEESLADNAETEGEQDSINMEDRILQKTLFPELVGDLEKRNLKLETWLFGRQICIRNVGADNISLEQGVTKLAIKKSKQEFILGEDITLEAGECLVFRRENAETPEACVGIFDWEFRLSDKYVIDEVDLIRKNKVISRSIIINDAFYNKVMRGFMDTNDSILGDLAENRMAGNADKKNQAAANQTCRIF